MFEWSLPKTSKGCSVEHQIQLGNAEGKQWLALNWNPHRMYRPITTYYYHLPTELWEGNVFSHVHLSICLTMVVPM